MFINILFKKKKKNWVVTLQPPKGFATAPPPRLTWLKSRDASFPENDREEPRDKAFGCVCVCVREREREREREKDDCKNWRGKS